MRWGWSMEDCSDPFRCLLYLPLSKESTICIHVAQVKVPSDTLPSTDQLPFGNSPFITHLFGLQTWDGHLAHSPLQSVSHGNHHTYKVLSS